MTSEKNKPKTMKHPSHGTIPAELPCTYQGCVDTFAHSHEYLGHSGAGRLERKSSGEIVYHTPWTRKRAPFKLAPLKARQESSSQAFERIKKAGLADDIRDEYTGRACPDGYQITATNGHWALLEVGPGNGISAKVGGLTDGYRIGAEFDNPELELAIKRAAIMAHERARVVVLVAEGWGISVYSQDTDVGDFTEHVSVEGHVFNPWAMALNVEYLSMALGCWPLTVWLKDEESALILEPRDKTWRFVLMPVRWDLDKAKAIVKEARTA